MSKAVTPKRSTKRFKELKPEQLYRPAPVKQLKFKTTKDLDVLTGVIEQDRAMRALDLGIHIDKLNYNIFVAGTSGTGKTTLVKTSLSKLAPTRETPCDWVCVHNFKEPSQPRTIKMAAGTATGFKRELTDIVAELREQIPKVFHSKEHQEKVQSILNESLDAENQCFVELNQFANTIGFTIKSTKTGIVTIPMLGEKVISNKDYAHLTEEERKEIEERRKALDPVISAFLQRTREIEVETHRMIQEIQRDLGDAVASTPFEALKENYEGNERLRAYLTEIFNDILDNLPKFLPDESDPEQAREAMKRPMTEYAVNVLVDNSNTEGAPVVFEHRPTFSNLFGKIERRLENGVYLTDFTMVRAGSLMQSSGGYLILNVLDLFQEPGVWGHLKSCLRHREVSAEDPGFLSPFLPTTGLKPEPMPVHTKIILLGSNWAYYVLHRSDEDFRKIFQVIADFDDEIDRTRQTCREYAQFVATTCKNDKLLPVTKDGVGALIEEGSRLVDSKNRLTLRFNDVANLVIEANFHAQQIKARTITRKHVDAAIKEREHRNSLVADKLMREIDEGRQLIDVSGEEVGQINGLAVYSTGAYRFGKPCRITANTFAGKSGIINIEREAKLSGRIHDKGMYIINGYMGDTYAQDAPLSLSMTVCFEQSYGGIDGDSASSTELYAILSSLSDVPIKQGIAVTGSVNQKGLIQPIGGVNEKVEGHFQVCANDGLTGTQGVMIPHQNVSNLMLRADVREAVAHGMFHIWPIKTIDEGITLLTGVVAGNRKADGTYPKGTIHHLVLEKLKHYAAASAPKKKETAKKTNK